MNPHLHQFIWKLPKDRLTLVKGNIPVLRNGDVYYPFRQDSDFLYLTGLSAPGLILTIYYTEVIIWREPITEHDNIWWSDKLTDNEMREISWIEDIRDISELENYCTYHQPLSFWVYEESTQKTEITEQMPPPSAWQELRNIPSWQSIIHGLRTIKTSREVEKIQHCIRITESIYEELVSQVQPWMYEYELEAMIASGFRRHHGTEAFPTIVASGINSCTLHYTKNTRQIGSGDIVLLDFGIEIDGYGADISRTFAVWGFSHRQQEIYNAVEDVKRYAENTLKPWITRKVWNLRVKEYMYEVCENLHLREIEKYTPITNPYYPHSIGHFLWLDTHDVGNSDSPFEPGMILTIEPGIYIRDEAIWIRIEDDYLVTSSGCVKLS